MTLNEIKAYLTEYAKDYDEGRLSSGLDLSTAITMNAEELQEKEQLNTYINATINVLSAV